MNDLWGEPSDESQRMLERRRYYRIQEEIRQSREAQKKEWLANCVVIHWDSAMWKKTMEHLPVELRKWVSDNRKTGKRYILSDPLLRLGNEHVACGFFIAQMTSASAGNSYVIQDRSLLNGKNTELIEVAIIKTAIQCGHLSRTIHYKGQRLLSDESTPTPSQVSVGFVYFVRNGDIFKIGITENLVRRFNEIKPDEILNVVRCLNYKEVERRLHSEYKQDRIPQSEYFRLSEAQVNRIHSLLLEWADQ